MDNNKIVSRQNYNKNYYETNKETILKKACEKMECQFCKRTVIKNNLISHYKSDICKRKSELLKTLEERRNQSNP
jgi:hypothetical protein